MSEIMGGGFTVPSEQDFDTLGFKGSMQQVLQENVGKYVIVEFLIGTNGLTSRQGLLYYVGSQFLVLFDEFESRYVVCDIFSVKFVTFLLPGYRPGQVPSGTNMSQVGGPVDAEGSLDVAPTSSPAYTTPAQAAYAHAVRRSTSR